MATDYKEIVTGIIVGESGPIKGADVSVFDKDLMVDDHLGCATTDEAGKFEVEFKWSDYKDGPYEDRPDIYLNVKTPDGKSFKSKVFDEMSGTLADDDSVEVFDLGKISAE